MARDDYDGGSFVADLAARVRALEEFRMRAEGVLSNITAAVEAPAQEMDDAFSAIESGDPSGLDRLDRTLDIFARMGERLGRLMASKRKAESTETTKPSGA
jgi:hypothetical protein